MKHQAVSLKHRRRQKRVFDTSDPGTGKTAVCLWAYVKRWRKNKKPALVLAPRSLLKTTWADDVKKFAPELRVSIARAENREKAFQADADIYVTNHDAVKWLAKKPAKFFQRFGELIIDESTAYKHHTSQRSRAAAKIAQYFEHRTCLTATPNGASITDVWHQMLLLDDGARLGRSFFAFRNTTCIPHQVGPRTEMIRWVDRPGAEEAVFGMLSDVVIRHKFEDCVDIPANHEYTVAFTLSAKTRKAYDQLETSMILPMVKAGAITAVNAAAVMTKLLQICSGAVYDNDGKAHLIDTSRYELVMDLAEVRKHPLVFFYWQHQRDQFTLEADRRGMKFAVIDGKTTDRERDAIVAQYQAGKYDVLLGHPRSMAHGMTLTRGTSTIWPGPTYDAELFKQGSNRQYRIGQKYKTENIMILAENTREAAVYEILQGKNARMKNLLDLFQL